jgi:hypothetical protein
MTLDAALSRYELGPVKMEYARVHKQYIPSQKKIMQGGPFPVRINILGTYELQFLSPSVTVNVHDRKMFDSYREGDEVRLQYRERYVIDTERRTVDGWEYVHASKVE